MKPDFALNFTDTSIALLHRTAKGWLKIGETPFEASDLEDALDYMRKTAQGLAPGGFTTKLVIPASQILYTEVDISGGDADRTRQEITNAIEARTPYKAHEVALDWVPGRGRTARVAAVARETLEEAEAFAVTHKFGPVSFVAIPAEGAFEGEPWFGVTAESASLLAPGETVERDQDAIMLIDEARAARRKARAARKAELEADAEPETDAENEAGADAPAAADAADTGADLWDKAAPTEQLAEQPTEQPAEPESESTPAETAAPASAVAAAPSAGALAQTATTVAQPLAQPELPLSDAAGKSDAGLKSGQEEGQAHDFDAPSPLTPQSDTLPGAPRPAPQPGPRVAITEIAPIGNKIGATQAGTSAAASNAAAPAASAAPHNPQHNAQQSKAAPQAAETDITSSAAAALADALNGPAGAAPAPRAAASPSVSAAVSVQPSQVQPADGDPDEAPFAHVPENTSFPDADEAPDLPPLPHLARRMAGLPPSGTVAAPASAAAQPNKAQPGSAQPAPPQASVAKAAAEQPAAAEDTKSDDDLPPRPSDATLNAYNRSARATNTTATAQPAAPARPAGGLAGGHGRAVPAAKPAARGLSGLVTAASIPGTRKTRPQPAAAAQPRATDSNNDEAARSLGQPAFANRPGRGKPRFLGLILTAVLLLCLALVAAWSSLYLSSNRDASEEETQFATANQPSPEQSVSQDDEMLADGIDPEAAADGVTGEEALATNEAAPATTAQAEAAPETSPETATDSESPASVALLGSEDEIFLSAADAPPPAFDALSLPGPEATAEAPPGAPMPPPPFGTVYQFDENGLLLPTAAGLPTPGGFMLYEGKPPRVPPARSAVAEAAAAAARAAQAPQELPQETQPESAPAGQAPVATVPGATTPATEAAGNPSLAGDTQIGAPPVAAPVATSPAEQPNPELANRPPRPRPEGLTPPASPYDDASLGGEAASDTQFAGLRPRARPAAIEAASAQARAETATASLASEATLQLASAAPDAAQPGLSPEEAANPSIMTISRRPAAKPKDFSRAVEAAVAAAVRAPDPVPEAAPEQVASAAPAPKSNSKSAAKPDEQDEIDEPEVASKPAPQIPTRANVAKQATFAKAINLSKVNLIGVYGTQSKRHALVRLANGKYRKVNVGDKIDGGQVKAITQNEVRYQKGGRLIALTMPKG
ncbi:hypothetical protein HOY34_19330 [Xinfangfangia sp. D13-10-4-6]|uniref:hypothetical protein n=1 Tax=Pseudogemmobacter hezensis TaxID=2737662 RepID=UPI00155750E9|nr:hypothetical protein [Pseudogemmobacter hezensis]NPD17341.1 hypothetical protein [Pseudogemmobacter hezensis]